jgi:hypothetical protein
MLIRSRVCFPDPTMASCVPVLPMAPADGGVGLAYFHHVNGAPDWKEPRPDLISAHHWRDQGISGRSNAVLSHLGRLPPQPPEPVADLAGRQLPGMN